MIQRNSASRRHIGRLATLLVALAAVFGLTASVSAPAFADTTLRLCVIPNSSTMNISPALHLTDGNAVPVTLNGSGTLTSCGNGLTGTYTVTGTAKMGCSGGSSINLNWAVNWSDGTTSSVTTSGTQIALNGTYTGSTTSGALAGTKVVSVESSVFQVGQCTTRAGLSKMNVVGNLEFIHVG